MLDGTNRHVSGHKIHCSDFTTNRHSPSITEMGKHLRGEGRKQKTTWLLLSTVDRTEGKDQSQENQTGNGCGWHRVRPSDTPARPSQRHGHGARPGGRVLAPRPVRSALHPPRPEGRPPPLWRTGRCPDAVAMQSGDRRAPVGRACPRLPCAERDDLRLRLLGVRYSLFGSE